MQSSRRHFIKTAPAAGMLFKLSGPKPQLKAAGPNDQIGVGFIGIGIRGSYHLENFYKTPGVRTVMAADCYDGHLAWAKEATDGKIEVTRDYQQVLQRNDIDAVVISTPDHWHCRQILDALDAGKHVYIEKPMTYSIEEGEQVIEAVKKSGRLLMVGSQMKTSALTAKAREVIQAGLLGKVNMARLATNRNSPEGAWVYPIPADASPQTIDWKRWLGPAPDCEYDARRVFRWRCFWEYSGGVTTDLWVHSLTTFHEMMNVPAPLSVVAQGGILRWDDGRTVPDVMTAVYEYPGFLLEITANLGSTAHGVGQVIMGSEASLTFTRRGLLVTFEPEPSPVAYYGLNGWTKAMKEQYLASLGFSGGRRPENKPAKPPQEIEVAQGLEHHEYFIQSLRDGTPSKETAEEGHAAAGAAHLANVAMKKGSRMRWEFAQSKITAG